MIEWLKKLFSTSSETSEQKREGGPDDKGLATSQANMSIPHKLTPVDASMIQARFNTLGIYDHLESHREQELKRIIFTHCREGRTEIWWWPLQAFLENKRVHSGDLPFQVVAARGHMIQDMRRRLISLEALARTEGLQIRGLLTPKGELAHDRDPIEDGDYQVKYQIRDKENSFPIQIREGKLDVPFLARHLNGICQRHRWSYRFVVLPPMHDTYCVLRCVLGVAERAMSTKWGLLEYPEKSHLDKAPTEKSHLDKAPTGKSHLDKGTDESAQEKAGTS